MTLNDKITREALAEFIGTFMLVLIGAGSVVVSPPSLGALGPALGHGLILVAIISTYGHISGAHVNPAVSLAVWVGGKLETFKLGIYIVAQILGALVAALILRLVLPDTLAGFETLGQTSKAGGVDDLQMILIELISTFILASAVFQAAVYGNGGPATPVIIGVTLAALILFGGPLTGASLNPARTIGPAFVAEETQDIGEVVLYLVAIFGGGALAGAFHGYFLNSSE
jgi:MIP family channel proteins